MSVVWWSLDFGVDVLVAFGFAAALFLALAGQLVSPRAGTRGRRRPRRKTPIGLGLGDAPLVGEKLEREREDSFKAGSVRQVTGRPR